MRRVFADASGIRATFPGYDAETDANPTHFIFDSRNRAYFSAFMTGVVPGSTFAGTTSGTGFHDVMFGKTFPSPPAALVLFGSAGFTGLSQNFLNSATSSYMFASFTSMVDRLRIWSQGSFNGVTAEEPIANTYFIVANS